MLDSGQDGCRQDGRRPGQIQERKNLGQDISDVGKNGSRTGRMQDRSDAGQNGCRTGWMQDRTDAGHDRCSTIRMQCSIYYRIVPMCGEAFK